MKKLKIPFKKNKSNEENVPAAPKKGRRKKIFLLLLLLAVIIILLLLLAFFNGKKKRSEALNEAFTRQTTTITRQTLTNSISATGTIESAETKTVNTKMTNMKVLEVYVKEGDYVEEGTIICEFDASDYEEALAEAKNNYSVNQQISNLGDDYTTIYNEAIEQAEDGLESVREVRDDAKDAYNDAKDQYNLKKTAYEQAEKKYKETSASADSTEETINTAKTNYEKAKAELQEASALCEQTKVAYEQAQAKREDYQEQYEAAIEKAQYDYDKAVLEEQLITQTQEEKTIEEYTELIEDCVIKADMSGVITSLNVTAGNNFEGGDIYTIQDNENFIVSSTVDEYDISSIEKGMTAYVKTDATGDIEMTGEVSYVAIAPEGAAGVMGAISSSASYRIEVTIHDPAETLRAGMTAKVSIALEESADALTVPYDAVSTSPDGVSTITVEIDGEEKTITVETGLETDYYTEIISDEISEGMTVYLSTPLVVANPENGDNSEFPGMTDGGFPGGGEMPSGGGFGGNGGGMPSGGGGMPSGGGPGGF